jgi:hypothetical protein
LQVAGEAATDIASAAVIYPGGHRPDATGTVLVLGVSNAKVVLSGGERAAKTVEGDDSFN